MNPTRTLLQQHRQPLIRFLGKRSAYPKQPQSAQEATPKPHPASPSHALPESFASYRQKAVQHGPLQGREVETSAPPSNSSSSNSSSSSSSSNSSKINAGAPRPGIGGRSGHSLGSIQAGQGQFFDREELPRRFQRTMWTPEEIEAIESGGASMRA